MVDFPDAIAYFVDPSRTFINQNSHSAIVLHGTGGSASQTAQELGAYFRTTSLMTSSHYGIDRSGIVAQYVPEKDGAAANCCTEPGYDPFWDQFGGQNLNTHTISIEHVNDESNDLALTTAQQAASFKLIKYLCNKYDIAPGCIKSHASIDPLSRERCPGAYPWDELWAFLKEEGDSVLNLNDPVVATFFSDGGNGTWKCNNGVVLMGANLTFYRSNGGPALFGLPLANEIHIPLSHEIAIVPCERALIVYDPDKKIDNPPGSGLCYLLHLQQGVGQQLLMQDANAAIKTLTDKINQAKAALA